jgi:hypothetical protein
MNLRLFTIDLPDPLRASAPLTVSVRLACPLVQQMAVKSWRGAHRLVEAASSTAKASSSVHTGPTVVPAMPDDIYNYVRLSDG